MVLVLVRNTGDMFIPFHLRHSSRKKIDVPSISVVLSSEGSKMGSGVRASMRCLHRKSMRR